MCTFDALKARLIHSTTCVYVYFRKYIIICIVGTKLPRLMDVQMGYLDKESEYEKTKKGGGLCNPKSLFEANISFS